MYAGLSTEQAPPEDIPLRFFLTAPLFGLLAALQVVIQGEMLFFTNLFQPTIALTHLITLGLLAFIMMGALYQMIPVLVGGSVPVIPLARVVYFLMLAGVLFLVLALLTGMQEFFILALCSLPLGVGLFAAQILWALYQVEENQRPTVAAMRTSLWALVAVLILGVSFLGSLAGWWQLPGSRTAWITSHAFLGLFGWVGLLIMGVGFHVIPMFYITKAFPPETAYKILGSARISLFLFPAALLAEAPFWLLLLTGLPALAALLLFAYSIRQIFAQRRRKLMDSTFRAWQSALVILPLPLALLLVHGLWPQPRLPLLFGVAYLLGFVFMVLNGMLFKIVPFILWFHRFSHLIGKEPVPLLKDMLDDAQARKQWKLALLAWGLLFLGVLLGQGLVIRLGGLVWAVGFVWLWWLLLGAYRTRTKPQA